MSRLIAIHQAPDRRRWKRSIDVVLARVTIPNYRETEEELYSYPATYSARNNAIVLNMSSNTNRQLNSRFLRQGTLKRREHINHSKFFDCCCKRCADPTELGTYASAFRCPRCAGRVVPRAPLDARAAWACADGCHYSMPAAAVQMLLKRFAFRLTNLLIKKIFRQKKNTPHTGHYTIQD